MVAVRTIAVFAFLAAAAQGSKLSCSDASSVCTANAELLSMINDHSDTDHLSYVQKKVAKVGQTPDEQLEKAVQEAEANKDKEDNSTHYEAPPPDEFGGTWRDHDVPGYYAEPHPVFSTYVPLEWAYEDKGNGVKGPSHWGEIPGDGACAAPLQSPVDFALGTVQIHPTLNAKDLELTKETTPCDMNTKYVLNPRTLTRVYEGNCSTTFKAIWKEKVFYLNSFHYSSPSQHTIDGAYYPIEVHHVHKAADDEQKLIIAVMVSAMTEAQQFSSQDKAASDFFGAFIKHAPHADKKHANHYERIYDSEEWDPYQEFLRGHLGDGFYHYVGSTTSPPCQLDTIWMIDPVPIAVESEHIGKYRRMINKVPDNALATFSSIMGLEDGAVPNWANDAGMGPGEDGWNAKLGCNIRPTRPLDGRTLWVVNVSLPTLTTAEPLPGEELFASKKAQKQ